MVIKRRDFLKFGGLTLLGTAVSSVVNEVLSGEVKAEEYEPSPKQLVGKHWGIAIEVKKCKEAQSKCGFKCIEVCNYLHNIPQIPDKKKEIKWIWHDEFEHAFPEQGTNEYLNEYFKGVPFILLCNHCEHPPCVRVCPTRATFKREDGIVMMDYHRCIGCRFCMAACPYGARSFNWYDPRRFLKKVNPEYPTRTKGVVEKCMLCYERLADGKIPACVEACPVKALHFGDLNDPNSEINKVIKGRMVIRRKEELGTGPSILYIVD